MVRPPLNETFDTEKPRRRSGKITSDVDDAQEALRWAKKALQSFKDSKAAGFVFRKIRPICCPSCDEVFTADRELQRKQAHVCVVCEAPETTGEDYSGEEQALEDAVVAAVKEVKSRSAALSDTDVKVGKAFADMQGAKERCEQARARLASPSPRVRLESGIIRLEAQIDEVKRTLASASEPATDEASVLRAAADITEGAYKSGQKALLQKVSELALNYARTFGVENLDAVSIDGAAHMNLTIAGKKASYSSRSPGDRARLKIAATLAIIKVADTDGVGRHPGLLLIDSPGGAEMVDVDYEQVLKGFAGIPRSLTTCRFSSPASINR